MTVAYNQGRRAFEQFKPNSANPYPISGFGNVGNNARVEWFNGWFDEWRWQKWGPNEDEKYEPLTPAAKT